MTLSKTKLKHFKQLFLQRKEDLTNSLSRELLSEQSQDENDVAQYLTINAMIEQQIQRDKLQIKSLSEALRRIEDGNFGICEQCEEPINDKRLEAVPLAKYCLNCAELHEKRAKQYRSA